MENENKQQPKATRRRQISSQNFGDYRSDFISPETSYEIFKTPKVMKRTRHMHENNHIYVHLHEFTC